MKQSKENARRKSRRLRGSDYGSDDDDDLNLLERQMIRDRLQSFGQIENCEICGKRFTATAYSGTGPEGGLLCPKCSRDQANKEKKPKAKKAGPRSDRRKNQSNLLDGVSQPGASSLVDMCIKVSELV